MPRHQSSRCIKYCFWVLWDFAVSFMRSLPGAKWLLRGARCTLIVLWIWIMSSILSLPHAFVFNIEGTEETGRCIVPTDIDSELKYLCAFSLTIGIFTPMLLVGFCVAIMAFLICRKSPPVKKIVLKKKAGTSPQTARCHRQQLLNRVHRWLRQDDRYHFPPSGPHWTDLAWSRIDTSWNTPRRGVFESASKLIGIERNPEIVEWYVERC